MKRTLFVSDLDGTLLGADSRVSPRSVQMLNEAVGRGALFTVATARTPATVVPLMQNVRMSLPAIVMTGAAAYETAHGFYTSCSTIADTVADEIEAAVRACGVTPFRYTMGPDGVLDTYYSGTVPSDAEQLFIDQRKHMVLKRMHINEPAAAPRLPESTIMFFAMGPMERISDAACRLRAAGCCSVSCYTDSTFPGMGLLEVFRLGVSKAAAIRRLAAELRVDSITVFGDNLNDLPMMEIADTAIAVANAAPEVLAAADLVIGSNTDDSVARHILDIQTADSI